MPYFIRLSISIFVLLTLGAVVAQAQPAPAASPSTAAKATTGGKPAILLPPEKAQPVRMPKFEKPPVIAGKLDDEIGVKFC